MITTTTAVDKLSATRCPGDDFHSLCPLLPCASHTEYVPYQIQTCVLVSCVGLRTTWQASSSKRVKNFGADLRDGEALSVLLTQLDPHVCTPCKDPLGSDARARHIIRNAKV